MTHGTTALVDRHTPIDERIIAVWIGGTDDPDWVEYNTAIDPIAVQVVLEDSSIEVWQVPRDSYRQALASMHELRANLTGPVGRALVGTLEAVQAKGAEAGFDLGETYILDDSPLVLLTALQSSFEPWPSSSRSSVRTLAPGRTIRVWEQIDVRLMMADMYAKLAGR
ncbi:hypothetical protein [Aestuariimicrobium ganziense]|uniref:hypothetical protein n=1 Tax=Aestuariimicrobium ganziense TaxID=2773677 RepID=UPI0019441473|nr:hypothetical protein [Aestuariimicrobium ganziense]